MKAIIFIALFLVSFSSYSQSQCNFHEVKKYVMLDDVELVNKFTQKCPKLLYQTNFLKQTFLHIAVDFDSINVAKFLVNQNLDVNQKDRNQKSPLHFVQSENMINFLLENQANLYSLDDYGNTPFYNVLAKKNRSLIEGFLNQGHLPNEDELTYAADFLGFSLLSLISSHATHKNIQNTGRYFRSFYFRQARYQELAVSLIKKGAKLDLGLSFSKQRTPLAVYAHDYLRSLPIENEYNLNAILFLVQNGSNLYQTLGFRQEGVLPALLNKKDFDKSHKILNAFIKKGIDLDYFYEVSESTVLESVVNQVTYSQEDRDYNEKILFELKSKKVQVNKLNRENENVIHLSVKNNNFQAVKLFATKTLANQKSNSFETPIQLGTRLLDKKTWEEKKKLVKIIKYLKAL